MTLHAYQHNLTFELEECFHCHAPFMMTTDATERLRNNHKSFYCPYCKGSQYYPGKTNEQKLKEKLVQERQRKEAALRRANEEQQRADQLAKKEKVQRASRIRLKKRIINGVCPCCNRHFPNLFSHIKTKHQDWIKQLSLKEIREEMVITQTELASALDIRASYISSYERDKYLPEYAKEKIEDWINEQALDRAEGNRHV